MRIVADGRMWMDPKITPAAAIPTSNASAEHLTPREQKVLRHVFEGRTNKEMAYDLGVSLSSIKETLQNLFDKMGVRTHGQLFRIAIERSLETASAEREFEVMPRIVHV